MLQRSHTNSLLNIAETKILNSREGRMNEWKEDSKKERQKYRENTSNQNQKGKEVTHVCVPCASPEKLLLNPWVLILTIFADAVPWNSFRSLFRPPWSLSIFCFFTIYVWYKWGFCTRWILVILTFPPVARTFCTTPWYSGEPGIRSTKWTVESFPVWGSRGIGAQSLGRAIPAKQSNAKQFKTTTTTTTTTTKKASRLS